MNKIYYLLLFIPLFIACKKESNQPYTPTGNTEYPLNQASPSVARLQEYKVKYGTTVLYSNLHERDYVWDFQTKMFFGMHATAVTEVNLPLALDFLDQHLLPYYSTAFLKDYLPYRIALADSCYMFMDAYNLKIPQAFMQTEGTMLMANINKTFVDMNAAQKKAQSKKLHEEFFKYLSRKLQTTLPAFFSVSNYNYGNGAADPTNSKELGFWAFSWSNYAPKPEDDIIRWLKEIANTKEVDMNSKFYLKKANGEEIEMQLMKKKYDAIMGFFKSYSINPHQLNAVFL